MTFAFPYSLDNKRYHTWNFHLKQLFGCKVAKIALDAGFTCPNIDGAKGFGGCTFCSPRGSGDFAGNPDHDIEKQYILQRNMMLQKWPNAKCIAYFQAHSNTYAPVEILRDKFNEALSCPDVVGICIATRADLLQPDIMKLLTELSRKTWLLVELGLQTIHDSTALHVNRCHDYQAFLEGYYQLKNAGIPTCIHIMNALPGESRNMMMETAQAVNELSPHSVKIHMLHVIKNTVMAKQYQANPFYLPSMLEYIDLVCDQLALLSPEIVIQRLTGDAKQQDLIAPEWVTYKRQVLNGIDKELVRRDSWQGKQCK